MPARNEYGLLRMPGWLAPPATSALPPGGERHRSVQAPLQHSHEEGWHQRSQNYVSTPVMAVPPTVRQSLCPRPSGGPSHSVLSRQVLERPREVAPQRQEVTSLLEAPRNHRASSSSGFGSGSSGNYHRYIRDIPSWAPNQEDAVFTLWLRRLTNVLAIHQVTDDVERCRVLLDRLPDRDVELIELALEGYDEEYTFDDMVAKCIQLYEPAPVSNSDIQKLKQESTENIKDFFKRLIGAAKACDLPSPSVRSWLIHSAFTNGLRDVGLQRRVKEVGGTDPVAAYNEALRIEALWRDEARGSAGSSQPMTSGQGSRVSSCGVQTDATGVLSGVRAVNNVNCDDVLPIVTDGQPVFPMRNVDYHFQGENFREGDWEMRNGKVESSTCMVRQVPRGIRDGELWEMFEKWGRVAQIRRPKGEDGRPRSFCFVVFSRVCDARQCIRSSGQTYLGGVKLEIESARVSPTWTPPLASRGPPTATMGTAEKEEFIAFYGGHSPLSNFYPYYHVNPIGDRLWSTEQAYQLAKAQHFGDGVAASAILAAKLPSEAHDLGKRINLFDQKEWDRV